MIWSLIGVDGDVDVKGEFFEIAAWTRAVSI
jgi:hypothetical protein